MVVDLAGLTEARERLAAARGVLFDFDGPICRLFPEGVSVHVADELRRTVDDFGAGNVLAARERTDIDPHVVLRAVHRAAQRDRGLRGLVAELEKRVTDGELAAVPSAWGTPGAEDLIRTLFEQGRRLAVVTNNSPRAASAYLEDKGLCGCFETIHGRTNDPGLMKPHPHVLTRALRSLDLAPEDAVMIGDTATDVEAADRAGVPFIGYGRNARKESGLRGAGASLVLSSYGPLLDGA
ncbi:HAD family hydrolase [Streptomyces ureilyticus]|uniref:HAD family hydrolase n=1 Tax=Streptomyces ureilyticus TaxID=1775131 RepID=A0ABX0DN79_9ACTN|nr:HAD family hydrolase [Streptomyces ureilyticus]NGO43332.1 HAD family hydrolase [Streptomyces ureilyticus]